MWEGGEAWIIGGGPSIITEFNIPDNIVQKVLRKELPLSAYSPYMKAIHKKHTIGINVAYMLGKWIDIVFLGDGGFFCSHKQGLASFAGIKVTCHSGANQDRWIKYLGRDGKRPKGISSQPDLVSWNGNSGAAAISLAAHTGVKRIILVGFDMKLNGENRLHFHDCYNKGIIDINDERKRRKLPFDRHLRGFPFIAEDAAKRGLEIINACPDSAITQFPKCHVKDLL